MKMSKWEEEYLLLKVKCHFKSTCHFDYSMLRMYWKMESNYLSNPPDKLL
jgi:hypothetical protein